MTDEICSALEEICAGKTAFCAIGNADRADDGAGMVLGTLLEQAGIDNVFFGGMTPEKVLPSIRDNGFDSIVFLDAVDIGAETGAFAFLDAMQIVSLFPQVSTHKMSLATLAAIVCDTTQSRVWLIGIQPQSIAMSSSGISTGVFNTIEMLSRCIADTLTAMTSATNKEYVCK